MRQGLKKQLIAAVVSAAFAAAASAAGAAITQSFSATTGCGIAICGTSGGVLTFEEIAGNQLKITIDNTTDGATDIDPGAGVYENSSVITGFVFNVSQDIAAASVVSFTDGSNNAITGWTLGLFVNNETTPGNSVFEVGFETTNGINKGIYNAASPGSSIANVLPDIATLIISVTQPTTWDLQSIGSDSILRMQRVGLAGQGSLKIPTSTSSSNGGPSSTGRGIPEPSSSSLALLGIAALGASMWMRRRTVNR